MQDSDSILYCTWAYRRLLTPALRVRFRDLDHLVRSLLASASTQLYVVAPYLSEAAMTGIQGSIASSVARGAWVRVVTEDVVRPDSGNYAAVRALLAGASGRMIEQRLRILTPLDPDIGLFHSKAIIVDGERGYLGSANISWHGLEHNFELGVALDSSHASALQALLALFESIGLLTDCTDAVLGLLRRGAFEAPR